VSFNRMFMLSLYLTLISSSTVIAAAEHEPIYMLLMIAACVLHAAVSARRPNFALPRSAIIAMAFFAVGYAIYDIRTAEYVLFSAAHFIVILQIIKLFHIKRDRDIKELLLMSFVLAGVSAVLTADILFAPTLVLYVMCGVASQMLFTIRNDMTAGGAEPAVTRRMIGIGVALTVGCLAGATTVFLTFPRIGPSFTPLVRQFRAGLTGFSETVSLRGSGTLEPNPQIVFRAALSGPKAAVACDAEQLLWRGISLEHFDGNMWTINHHGTLSDERSLMLPYDIITDQTDVLTQTIELAPNHSRVLFGMALVGRLEMLNTRNNRVMYNRRRHTFALRTNRPGSIIYRVDSLPPPPESVLATASPNVREPIRRDNSQLPDAIRSRVRPLARQIAPDSACPTRHEKVRAVLQYLKRNYTYSSELPGDVEDPVGHFLFEKKHGHCEMFASSMVVLLRSLDIPARMVNGYKGGEWNEFLKAYLVRQSNAHAWVEVYYPGTYQMPGNSSETGSWVEFDPTPAGGDAPAGGLVAYIARALDYIHIRWNDNVIDYGRDQQATLAKYLTNLLSHAVGWMNTAPREKQTLVQLAQQALLIVPAAAAALGAALLCVALLRRRPRRSKTSVSRSRTKFYRELIRLLERRGHRRLSSQTPLEFARCVLAAEGPQWSGVQTITEGFCRVRYGNAENAAEAEAALKELRNLAKR